MDQSISSLLSLGSGSRDVSPNSERRRIIKEFESQTSALGHIGLLKWQRNDLRRELLQQKGVTEITKQNAANARKLALRLAAQIAVKEARLQSHTEALSKARGVSYVAARKNDAVIRDLESKLQDDLIRANALLCALGGSDGISRHDGIGFHINAQPISPPLSPFNGKKASGKRAKSPSSQYLPSEILRLCQLQAETLLRDYNDQQHSLHLQQQTESSLRLSLHENAAEIARHQASKAEIEEQMTQAKTEINRLGADSRAKQNLLTVLTAQKEKLESEMSTLNDEFNHAKAELDRSREDLAVVRDQLERATEESRGTGEELAAAGTRLKELEAAKAAISDEVELLRRQSADSNQAARSQLAERERQIDALQAEITKLQDVEQVQTLRLSETEHKLASLENQLAETMTRTELLQEEHTKREESAHASATGLQEQINTLEADIARERDAHTKSEEAAHAHVAELQAQIDGLQTEVAALQEQENEHADQLSATKEKLEKLELEKAKIHRLSEQSREQHLQSAEAADTRIAELQTQIEKHLIEVSTLQEDKNQQADRLLATEKKLEAMVAEKAGIKKQLAHVQEQHINSGQTAEARTAQMGKQIDGLRAEIAKSRQDMEEQTRLLSVADEKLKAIGVEKADIKQQLANVLDQHRNREEAAEFHATGLQKHIGSLNSEIVDLKQIQEQRQQEETLLRATLSQLEEQSTAYEQNHSATRGRLQEVEKSLLEAQESLRAERQRTRDLSEQHGALTQQLANHEKRAVVSDNVIKSLRARAADVHARLLSLEKDKIHLGEELAQSNSKLETAHDIENQLRNQITGFKNSVREHEASALSLRSMLEEAKKAYDSSSKRIVDLSSGLDGVNEKLLHTQAKYTECSIKLADSQKLHKDASSQLLELRQFHSGTLEALEIERQRNTTLACDLATEKNSGYSVKQILSAVQHDLDTTKQGHFELQAARAALETELGQLRSERDSIGSRLDREQTKCADLGEQILAAETSRSALNEELDNLRQLSQKSDGEMKQLRSSLAEALLESANLNNFNQSSSKAAQEQITDLKVQLATVEANLTKLQDLELENLEKSTANQTIITGLEQRVAHSDAQKSRMQDELQETSRRVDALLKSKYQLENDMRTSREEIQSLREIHQALQEEVSKARQQMRLLKNEKIELSNSLQAASVAKTNLEDANTSLIESLAGQQERLDQSQQEKSALEERIRASEATASELHNEIKQLTSLGREAQSQLRKSHAIRVSHEHALGSIRVRLGASKMAKRSVQIQLSQAERDVSALKIQNKRLETTLSNALSEVVEERNARSEQRENILALQEKQEQVTEKLLSSEENVKGLQAAVQQFETESSAFKEEIVRLKTAVNRADTENFSLRQKVTGLHDQCAKDQDELVSRQTQIEDLQNARTELECSLAEQSLLVASQQGDIGRLNKEVAADKAVIACLDTEKSSLTQLATSLKSEADARDAAMQDHRREIEQLERDLQNASRSAQELKSRLQDQESQNEKLRVQNVGLCSKNNGYAQEVLGLRRQLYDLTASKATLESQLEDRTREDATANSEHNHQERDFAYASSPTLVMGELEPLSLDERDEYFDFAPTSRPMSSQTRVGTSDSNLRAFRVLGAEAAASRPNLNQDNVRKRLSDMWGSQHRLGSVHEGNEEPLSKENKSAPRLRRKLTKKKKIEQLKTEEHKLTNLIRYGSFTRPAFERPMSGSTALSTAT